ncbi:MAG: hypothetical protein LBM23_10810 [Propionibacteriaceae bacterium]|jgi:uncharacterized protein YukE|nr:hypothetical protein [Propionibacteriaceae bacterium]
MEYGNDFFGMNIEEVRRTAGSMEQAAQKITDVVTRLNAALQSTEWRGPDADRFREEWNSQHAPAIRAVADDVRSSASEVRMNIEAQITTSRNY